MNKIKNVVNKGIAKVNELANKVVNGDSHFVAILVAIIVCIALAGIFKDEITAFIQSIVGDATTKAGQLF